MDIFNKINELGILDVLDSGGIAYKKDSGQPHTYTIKKQDGRLDNSFKVNTAKNIAVDFGGDGIKGGCFDIIGRLILQIDPQENTGKVAVIKWAVTNGLVDNPQTQKEFIKSLSGQELLDNFEDLKIGGFSNAVSKFLMHRGFNHDWIQKHKLRVGEVFADIGYYDNYFTTEKPTWKDENDKWHNEEGDKPKTVEVLLFPSFNETADLIGLKLRRVDGKLIRGKKSLAVGKTGLLYDSISTETQYLVEGETDWVVLKLLGYDNVVANVGGVQSGRMMLKSLLAETEKVVCLYDNDIAGTNGKEALQKTFKRPLYEIEYPIRKDTTGVSLSDINDYYNVGYDTAAKWNKLFGEATKIGSAKTERDKTDFIFLRESLQYYDTAHKKIQQTGSVAAYLGDSIKELASKAKSGFIKTFTDLCYREGGKDGYFNTLDESVIIKHGGDAEPILHPHIEYLIENVCNNKQVNVEWLHQSILYKLTHINDPYVPALILYGFGGSGKGSLLNLIGKIFGEVNLQTGLGQKDLEGSFDSYQGEKLVVEYKEISSGNKRDDKKILDRIKSMLSEKTISVNAKFQNVRQVESIARFHFSSNHSLPIQLDSKHSGNRRFTIIKTGKALDYTVAREMNEVTFNNELSIREYVARLYETFPDIPEAKVFLSLDNKEKRDLENSCEGVANLFFEWFERKYPYITKITNPEKNKLLRIYCQEIGEDYLDIRYKQSNFDLGLSHRYEKKKVRIRSKTVRGYYINKTKFDLEHIPDESENEFKEGEVNNFLI